MDPHREPVAQAVEPGSSSTAPTATVVAVQPAVAWGGGFTPVEVTVVASDEGFWPFRMVCSCIGCQDFGLCCYAGFCTTCLAAEINEYVGARGCCGTTECCAQWWSVCGISTALTACLTWCFVGPAVGPWVWTVWYTQGRDAMKAKYRLPHDELCGNLTCSSYLPFYVCFLECTCCALYQMAYFIKHTNPQGNHDFACCCYRIFCKDCCGGPTNIAAGPRSLATT